MNAFCGLAIGGFAIHCCTFYVTIRYEYVLCAEVGATPKSLKLAQYEKVLHIENIICKRNVALKMKTKIAVNAECHECVYIQKQLLLNNRRQFK